MAGSIASDADILRSREDPRLRQVLLARSLEQLLSSLHRMRATSAHAPADVRRMREGALMAVELADRIRVIDENIRRGLDA
jgi:hypothetical protein